MMGKALQSGRWGWLQHGAAKVYAVLAARAQSVIIFAALSCNLTVKLFHAARYGLLREYLTWIPTDVAVLITIEAALALVSRQWPRKGVLRGALIFAALVCTWSVINAGWLIRTGTQILPMQLWPLVSDPVNIARIVIANMVHMPGAAAVLLIPSAIALAFAFSVLAKPVPLRHDPKWFRIRMIASVVVAGAALAGNNAVTSLGSTHIAAAGMRFNCQSRAILAFLLPEYCHIARHDFQNAVRRIPRQEEIQVNATRHRLNHNVLIVVLEGVQYNCTSLATEQGGVAPQTAGRVGGLTPYLSTLAAQGASFTNARSVVTHTTKALFALLTGRLPAASQDISETVPAGQPYASLATILRRSLGFRTAFFQSAKGTFESRPGLVHNLGFDKFWSREDLGDPNQFVGYLGCDEFAMLDPMAEWIQAEETPFLLVVLCSVTHDPYQVPAWFAPQAGDLSERYAQTVTYTDRFLAALDDRLTSLHLADNTIFCVVGDHGEGFGEHRIMGHERLGFEEVLRIVMCVRAPFLIDPATRVAAPVSSLDLTPTILGLLGLDAGKAHFDGLDALRRLPQDRKLYFSGWMQEGPAGFVQRDSKFLCDPDRNTVTLYDLNADPCELAGIELPKEEAAKISAEIAAWRRATIFRPNAERQGNTQLFGSWLWKENGRVSRIKDAERK